MRLVNMQPSNENKKATWQKFQSLWLPKPFWDNINFRKGWFVVFVRLKTSDFIFFQKGTEQQNAHFGSYIFFSELLDKFWVQMDPVLTRMGPSDSDLGPPRSKKVLVQLGPERVLRILLHFTENIIILLDLLCTRLSQIFFYPNFEISPC